jgi:trans-2,3-dihydro-3-hydroxyanthranilate isomerase
MIELMPTITYHRVNVFTNRPFGGNPLAVFPDADGMPADLMQTLAREVNLSQSTFVQRATAIGANVRVRIFTSSEEMPMAGHPTLGTHYLLARLGRYELTEPVTRVFQEIGAGILPVDLLVRAGQVQKVVMTTAQPVFYEPITDPGPLPEALGIPESDFFTAPEMPIQMVSTGLKQVMVPLRSLKALRRISPRMELVRAAAEVFGSKMFYAFTRETLDPLSTTHSRLIMPDLVGEDPSTGSASGNLGAYLVHHKLVPIEPVVRISNEQGHEVGRPSRIEVDVETDYEGISAVKVGGPVVWIGQGTLDW